MKPNKFQEVGRAVGRASAVIVVTGTLLVPSFCSVDSSATAYADGEQTPTPTATATPQGWGGQGDDDDMPPAP